MDLERLARDLRAVFPGPTLMEPLYPLGAGFHSLAVETANGLVFRCARNAEGQAGQAKEARLLPALRAHLPVAVPDPDWYTGPCPQFPYGVICYPKLAGNPAAPASLAPDALPGIARQVGDFLRALHRFPVEDALALDVRDYGPGRTGLETLRAVVLPALQEALSAAEYAQVAAWWEHLLSDPRMQAHTPVLCHGDLWYENMLVDESGRTLIGVLDFEDAVVGDPAQDFAPLLYLGTEFANAALAVYAPDAAQRTHLTYRAQRFWELREFYGVGYAVRHADWEELEDSLRKLRAGPILNPRGVRLAAIALKSGG